MFRGQRRGRARCVFDDSGSSWIGDELAKIGIRMIDVNYFCRSCCVKSTEQEILVRHESSTTSGT
jgi:hypothetical protein